MTFKQAQAVIDSLPAGPERGEFSKLLTLVERAVSMAKSNSQLEMRQEFQSMSIVAQGLAEIAEIESLSETVAPKAKLPRGFGLWSSKMQLGWLRQNQA